MGEDNSGREQCSAVSLPYNCQGSGILSRVREGRLGQGKPVAVGRHGVLGAIGKIVYEMLASELFLNTEANKFLSNC